MRRSFGSNRRMGGGGGGGGGMLRTVGRAVGARVGGVQEAFSRSTTTTTTAAHNKPTTTSNLRSSSSSSSTSSLNLPVSDTSTTTTPTWPLRHDSYSFCHGDKWEWESVDGDGVEEETANGFSERHVFGSVPSKCEVEDAVSSLQQIIAPALCSQIVEDRSPSSSDKDVIHQIGSPTSFMHRDSLYGSPKDWIEPALNLYNPRVSQSRQCERVYDAFHLLQTEPSVQRMVISLSTDKAVWDAVLNNEVVRELKESLCAAENGSQQSSQGSSNVAGSILRLILDGTKAKAMELIEKIRKLVNEIFQAPEREKTTEGILGLFEDRLRSSLLLSVVVLLIVVISRSQRI
ncbi:PREDICTED: uncharacterized protein LOC104598470 [Nelumbo nucifera]|uniref:Uncharacterized protein LOC104598470 n=1 Tax=Nelumbo nucifera TaxID=4432 RepID=A0A1U7ZYD1_NELNU|nr:PREDICTED: uncharacterized protein LOC104598470 [Nelumbo nucifera]